MKWNPLKKTFRKEKSNAPKEQAIEDNIGFGELIKKFKRLQSEVYGLEGEHDFHNKYKKTDIKRLNEQVNYAKSAGGDLLKNLKEQTNLSHRILKCVETKRELRNEIIRLKKNDTILLRLMKRNELSKHHKQINAKRENNHREIMVQEQELERIDAKIKDYSDKLNRLPEIIKDNFNQFKSAVSELKFTVEAMQEGQLQKLPKQTQVPKDTTKLAAVEKLETFHDKTKGLKLKKRIQLFKECIKDLVTSEALHPDDLFNIPHRLNNPNLTKKELFSVIDDVLRVHELTNSMNKNTQNSWRRPLNRNENKKVKGEEFPNKTSSFENFGYT
ncbi:hypothetical protein [Wolbachia endosymbiont of Pentidionis agamae]|uniref:hypothetical protein n=1 Tax=Wolbachia endosymbiont of Pentidionis agamae TaxID=3110435 RepID=UPI002FD021BA